MAGINEMISKLESVNFTTEVMSAVEETKDQYKELQKKQMLKGEAKYGRIGKYRSKSYAARKAMINPLPGFGNADLKLTGSFQEKILVEVQAKSVVIKSTDSKAASLIKKYGDKIFGLNKENSIDYSWDVMGPIAIRNIKKKIL